MKAAAQQDRSLDARRRLLEVAAQEMYHVGYQSASLKTITQAAGVSKGCLYHHFENKQALGYAVLDELFADLVAELWSGVVDAEAPVEAIIGTLEQTVRELTGESLRFGCPISNLAQEMSPLDEGFRARVEKVHGDWHRWLVDAFENARRKGQVDAKCDSSALASLVMATAQGAKGLAKSAQDPEIYAEAISGLVAYLRSIRR
ncbi:MAG: TetR/AcrR family transcriptional regulator [Xanthomonadales bacterium]|nr:TetR/AcrR family transcriptional regulator [Xanthomonadales bacterium]